MRLALREEASAMPTDMSHCDDETVHERLDRRRNG